VFATILANCVAFHLLRFWRSDAIHLWGRWGAVDDFFFQICAFDWLVNTI